VIVFVQTVGPLAAKEVGSSDFFAPFTIGTFLIGAAVSSVPSGVLFRKYGRFIGFAIGCAMQVIGALFGAMGVYGESEALLFLGCFGVGLGQVMTYDITYPFTSHENVRDLVNFIALRLWK
jgi:MFS family permease